MDGTEELLEGAPDQAGALDPSQPLLGMPDHRNWGLEHGNGHARQGDRLRMHRSIQVSHSEKQHPHRCLLA